MKGSHKDNSCWKAFPHLKRGGKKEDDRKRRERDFRSKSRSQSRDRRPRYEKDRAPVSRTGEKEKSEGSRQDYRSGSHREEGYRSSNRNDSYQEYYEPFKQERRQSRPGSPQPGGSRETHLTGRVRPKMDFLQTEGGRDAAFHDNLSEPSQVARNVRRIKVKPNAT